MVKKLMMLFVAAMATTGAWAMETKYLGAPHCRVECYDDYWGDCTNIDPAESGKDYALVWADGEDSAAIPVVGDLTADMVVVNGGDAAAFLESVVIEDDALFKGSFGSNECDCGCATDDADRKWIVVRIKRSRLCSVPVSFSVGLKGLNEVRRFWVVPESWD